MRRLRGVIFGSKVSLDTVAGLRHNFKIRLIVFVQQYKTKYIDNTVYLIIIFAIFASSIPEKMFNIVTDNKMRHYATFTTEFMDNIPNLDV